MTDNVAEAYTQRLNAESLRADLSYMMGEGTEADTTLQGSGAAESLTPKEPEPSVLKDVGHGMIEIPMQVTGGMIDGLVNDVSDLVFDASGWLNENVADLGQMVPTEDGLEWREGMPETNELKVPTTPKALSTTGGFIREMSNFVSLFVGAGKLKWFKEFKAMTKTGRISKDALQGFVADFVNKPEGNLSSLIQNYPELENPVNEFLACDENCGEFDKRIRTALEGMGLGVAIDGVFTGLRSGLTALKSSRKIKQTLIDDNVMPEARLSDEAIAQATDTSILGDTSKPLFDNKPPKISPKQVTKKTTQEQGDVFINWARIDGDDELKSVIQNMADSSKGKIDKARRNVRSWEQTKLSAKEKDAWKILDDMNKRGRGATLNAEESLALRELWVRSGNKLKEVAQLAAADNSNATQFQFQKMLRIHAAIQEKAIAARTEAARSLNQWKIPAEGNLGKMLDIDDVMQMTGGTETSKAMAERYITLMDNPIAADTFARGSTWAKTKESVAQLWYFSLLSNPHTHARNAISNTATTVLNLAERKVASMLGDNVPPEEAMALLHGQVEGMKAALRITARGWKALGESLNKVRKGDFSGASKTISDNAEEFGSVYRTAATGRTGYGTGGKLDMGHSGNIAQLTHRMVGENLDRIPMSETMHRMAGMMDTAIQMPAKAVDGVSMIPSRALQSADEFFKTINYHSELHAQAVRKAAQAVKAGEIPESQFMDRVADLVADPDEFMKIASRKQGEYLTFTNKPPAESGVWKFLQGTGNLNIVPGVGRIIMPFTRVVYNIGSYTFERTPFAPMVSNWKKDIAKGGAARDIALARLALGTTALLTAVDHSIRGNITGVGSPDYGERANQRRMNIQPNSVKVGNRYYSYRGLEPLSSPLGIAANMAEVISYAGDQDNQQLDELIIAASLAIGNQMVSQQYMVGMANLFDGMSDPTRKGEAWFNSVAAAMVPAGVAQYNRSMVDTDMRQVENMVDAMRARIPGASQGLPYKRDLWGRKINLRSGLGEVYDMVSPVYSKEYKAEPIDLELQELGYFPQGLPRKLSFGGATIDMENYPKAWDRLKELSGNAATKTKYGVPIDPVSGKGLMDTLNMIVQGKHPAYPMYKYMTDGPDGGKALEIQKVIKKFREASKELLLTEFPEIKAEVDVKKAEQSRFDFGATP